MMIAGGFHKIPEAIKTHLEAQVFSESVLFDRQMIAYIQAEKTESLTCFVSPFSRTPSGGTRAGKSFTWRTVVAVVQSVATGSQAERLLREDELLAVADEIYSEIDGLKSIEVEGSEYPIVMPEAEPVAPSDPSYTQTKSFFQAFYVDLLDQ